MVAMDGQYNNDLEEYFYKNDRKLIHKWLHYFEAYDQHFKRYRGKEVTILEIGVFQGGSLQMWRDYFGPQAKIYGVDIEPKCKELEEEGIEIFIGSQSDREFLRKLKTQIPKVDILIEDGGHMMEQQIVTFEELFDHVKDDGVYLCEDLHSSYWLTFGGGHKRKSSFIEYSKNFIDWLHAYHSEQRSLQVSEFTRSVKSIHYYDSIIVLEKGRREAPVHKMTGQMSRQNERAITGPPSESISFKYKLVKNINKVLRFLNLPGYIWK